MKMPEWIAPGAWGAAGGAALAMIIGFGWGGWVTGGTAAEMASESAEMAVVEAVTPYCVERATQDPAQLALLQDESSWARGGFVTKAGWVADVDEEYRGAVADACATDAVEAMEAAADTKAG